MSYSYSHYFKCNHINTQKSNHINTQMSNHMNQIVSGRSIRIKCLWYITRTHSLTVERVQSKEGQAIPVVLIGVSR